MAACWNSTLFCGNTSVTSQYVELDDFMCSAKTEPEARNADEEQRVTECKAYFDAYQVGTPEVPRTYDASNRQMPGIPTQTYAWAQRLKEFDNSGPPYALISDLQCEYNFCRQACDRSADCDVFVVFPPDKPTLSRLVSSEDGEMCTEEMRGNKVCNTECFQCGKNDVKDEAKALSDCCETDAKTWVECCDDNGNRREGDRDAEEGEASGSGAESGNFNKPCQLNASDSQRQRQPRSRCFLQKLTTCKPDHAPAGR